MKHDDQSEKRMSAEIRRKRAVHPGKLRKSAQEALDAYREYAGVLSEHHQSGRGGGV